MRRKKLSTAIALVAVASTALLAGCSSSSSSSGSTSKTLNLSLTGAPASLDFAQFGTGTNPLLMSMLYDRLAYQEPNGTIKPQAATGWKYSQNDTVLTVALRPGMKFSNGDAVTAADVKATINRQIATKTNPQSAMFTQISSVDAPSATTVVIHLSAADPNLVSDMSSAVGLIGDPKTFSDKSIATDPVGSGPYTMDVSATVPDTKYVLKKNSKYWNAAAYPYSTVNVSVITDPTATFNALRSGQLDVAPISLDQAATAKGAGLTISEAPYAEVGAMLISDRAGKTIPALANVKVRQAINMVFDRSAMVSALNKGYGQATVEPFQPNSTGFVKSLANEYTYNVTKAKQLMTEAGYASGFSVSMPSVAGYTTAYEPTITSALAKINITVTWKSVPFSQIVGLITGGTLPLYYWPIGWNDMPTNLGVMVSPTAFFNGYHSETPAMDALLATATAAKTPTAQKAAFQAIGTYLIKEAWYAPLFTYPNLYAAGKTVVYSPNQVILTDNIQYYSPK